MRSGGVVAKTVKWVMMGSILCGVAAAIGLAHASVFAILDDIPRRWTPTTVKLRILNVIRAALCALIVCTYAWFELNNREWWFSIVAAWFVYLWVRLRRFLPRTDSPVSPTEATSEPEALAAP